MNFRTRLFLLSVMPVLVSAVLLTGYFLTSRLTQLDRELDDRAQALVRHVAAASEFGLFSGNRIMIEGVAKGVLKDRDVVAVVVRGGNGEPLISLGSPQALAEFEAVTSSGFVVARTKVERPQTPLDDLFASDTEMAQKPLGTVGVVISRDSQAAVRARIVAVALLVTGVLVFVAFLLALRFSRVIGERITELSAAVRRMGAGASDVRVSVRSGDGELETLAAGFNGMAIQIEESRRGLQQKIEAATRELNERRLDAERANQSKSRFLAAASHDLRQPLHALGLFADQLSRRSLPAEESRLVERVVASADALAELLDALLDISRLDAGALAPRCGVFSLAPILRRLQLEFGEVASERGLRWVVHDADRWVASDPGMIERILINLVSNALRYTDRGTVMVAMRRRGDKVRIEVRDSGIGIAIESQQLIFSEFVQLGNPERDRSKGLGLGLSIVQRMCGLLGHAYGVRSRPGRGSVFWVEVPAAVKTVLAEAAAPPADFSIAGRVVVVIEDDPLVQEGMCGQLRGWGFEVHFAASSPELMVRMARHGVRPDVIVCDQQLPGGEQGLQVIQMLRERYGQNIPAVLVTGFSSRDLQRTAAEMNLPILTKPVRPAKLRAVIQGVLAQAEDV